MTISLEAFAERLTAVEAELVRLRQALMGRPAEETAAERGARLLRDTALSAGAMAAGWAKALEILGIRGEPIGAENVRRMIAACGFKPEDNEFSRGIIEMREEEGGE